MRIYERLRQLCDDRGESITALEKELGFAKGSLSKIDKSSPSADRVQKLADHFHVSISYILTGEQSEEGWYLDSETAREAQRVFEDPDLRILFDAAKDSRPEDIRMAAEMLKRFKETNPNG